MLLSTFISTIASVSGFVASICFCIGAISTRPQQIKKMSAGMVWGTNQALSEALASQSAQYAIGGLLLVVSFLLQVAAVSVDPATLIMLHPVLSNPASLALDCFCSICIDRSFWLLCSKTQTANTTKQTRTRMTHQLPNMALKRDCGISVASSLLLICAAAPYLQR